MNNSIRFFFGVLVLCAVGTASADDAQLRAEIARLNAELQEVKMENQQLKKELAILKAAAKPAGAADPFKVGKTWSGTRRVTGFDAYDCSLQVVSRRGATFTGKFTFIGGDLKPHTIDVVGEAPPDGEGKVVFNLKTKGLLQQKYSGQLAGGEVGLTFDGNGQSGSPVTGVVTLHE